jgi:L-aspartate oxidase
VPCRRSTLYGGAWPEVIEWLSAQGVPFTREANTEGVADYHLHREGGHSHRRIVHAADATGRAIQTTLEERAAPIPTSLCWTSIARSI